MYLEVVGERPKPNRPVREKTAYLHPRDMVHPFNPEYSTWPTAHVAFMGIVCSVPEDVDSASTNLISTIGYDAPLRPAQLRDPPDYSDGQSRPRAIKRYLAAVVFTCRIRAWAKTIHLDRTP